MIRAIDMTDILECVNVVRESFLTVADEFGFTEENAPRFTAFATTEERLMWQFESEHRPMYAYFDDGNIVGYYSLAILEEHKCELNNLCVIPSYRHKGIGEQLLNHAFHMAKAMDRTKMQIGIVEENNILKRWYKEMGFIHTGTEKFDFFPFTCGYMERELYEHRLESEGCEE